MRTSAARAPGAPIIGTPPAVFAPANDPWAGLTWVQVPTTPLTAVPASGIPEAPTDGQVYARQGSSASWIPLNNIPVDNGFY